MSRLTLNENVIDVAKATDREFSEYFGMQVDESGVVYTAFAFMHNSLIRTRINTYTLDLTANTSTAGVSFHDKTLTILQRPIDSEFTGFATDGTDTFFARNHTSDRTFSTIEYWSDPTLLTYDRVINILKRTDQDEIYIRDIAFNPSENKLVVLYYANDSDNNVAGTAHLVVIDADATNVQAVSTHYRVIFEFSDPRKIALFEGLLYANNPLNISGSEIHCYSVDWDNGTFVDLGMQRGIIGASTPDTGALRSDSFIDGYDAGDLFFNLVYINNETLEAYDGDNFKLQRFTVIPNELPIFDPNTRLITETTIRANPPIGYVVRQVMAEDPDDDLNRITYSLEGTDAANFAIAPNGTITVNAALTNGTTYNITVKATDNSSGETTQDLTVVVLTSNPPVLPNLRQNYQIDAGAGMDVVLGTVTATHLDDDDITYSLTGTHATSFAISAEGVITTALASYTDITYELVVNATDENSNVATVNVKVEIYKMAVAATTYEVHAADLVFNVNRLNTQVADRYLPIDEAVVNRGVFSGIELRGTGEDFSVQISGNDAEFFFVSGNAIVIATQLEVDRLYVFDITAILQDGTRASQRVVVGTYERDPVVYPPAIIRDETIVGQVGDPIGTIMGKLTAFPSTEKYRYAYAAVAYPMGVSIIAAVEGAVPEFSQLFDLDPLTGTVRNRVEFSEPAEYTFTQVGVVIRWLAYPLSGGDVQFVDLPTLGFSILSDAAGTPDYQPNFREIALPPSLSGFVANVSVMHGTSYSLHGTDAQSFVINPLTGFLSIRSSLDADDLPFVIIVVAANIDGETSQLYVTMSSVSDAPPPEVQMNRAPVFSTNSQTFLVSSPSIGENVLGTVTATDPDADILTYSVESTTPTPPSNLSFAIDNDGEVTFNLASGTYGTSDYVVVIKATDPLGLSDTIDVHARVNDPDVNNAPFFDRNERAYILAANPTVNDTVATLTATDPDGDTLTYTLTGGNANLFSVNAMGVIRVAGTLVNGRAYTFNLNAEDPDGEDATIFITVDVQTIDIPITPADPILPPVDEVEGYEGFIEISGLPDTEIIQFITADDDRIYAFIKDNTNGLQGIRFIGRDGVVLTDSNFNIPNTRTILGLARVETTIGLLTMTGTAGGETGALLHYDLDGTEARLQELLEINGIDNIDLEGLPTYGMEYNEFERSYKIFAAGYDRVVRDIEYGDTTGNVIVFENTLTNFLGRPLAESIDLQRAIPLHSSAYGDEKYYLEFIEGRVDIYNSVFIFDGTLDVSIATDLGDIVDMAYSRGQVLILDDTGKIHYFGTARAIGVEPDGVRQLEITDDTEMFDIVRTTADFEVIANNIPAVKQTALELAEIESSNIEEALGRLQITPVTTIPDARLEDRIFLHSGNPDIQPSRLPTSGVYVIVSIISAGTDNQSFICETP